jgi:serine/threonine protein kinase
MPDRIGTEIAGYRIEALIARGGMGEVYLATQSFPERKVAVKVLARELADDQAFRERFIRESNAAASTEHPNIVPIYSAGEQDGVLYLAMRYVEGVDLGTLIAREGPLSTTRTAHIVTQVAAALDAAHRRGLIHRDVKPGNILIAEGPGSEDHTYLSDFGLIRRTELETGLTKTGQFMGSIDYCAPEQIRGNSVDARADVYSLGCVLYECLTGERPYARDSEVATLYGHLEDPPPQVTEKRSDLRSGIDTVIERSMAKRPDDRYDTAGELATAVGRELGVPR